MAGGAQARGDDENKVRLGVLCARLADLSGSSGEDAALDALTARLIALLEHERTAVPNSARSDAAVLDSVLDELDSLLPRTGPTGGHSSNRTSPSQPLFSPLPGMGNNHPLLEVLVCPRNRCQRVEIPDEAGLGAPRCRIFNERLKALGLTP